MNYLVARRIAELLKITIHEAEKLVPILQNEIFLNNMIIANLVIWFVIFISSLLIVLATDEYEKRFKIAVWACRISAILVVLILASWQFLVPTLTLFKTIK
jgi:hypothetical protein|nr:MAG TPA: hypothetical protein [Caudoviricetes sp.]